MRSNHSDDGEITASSAGQRFLKASSSVRVGIATGVSADVLSGHARELSNSTLEPVVQYVCVSATAGFAVVRRHWIAGHAPNVDLIGEDPDCVGCTIAEDIVRSADNNRDAGIATIDVILPPGTDAVHLAQLIDAQETLMTHYHRVVLDSKTIDDDVRSDADMTTTNMVTWEGDQRWVAHTTIGLVAAADQVLLTESADEAARQIALVNHLNPEARICTSLTELPQTSGRTADSIPAMRRAPWAQMIPSPAQHGFESSALVEQRRFHPQRLLAAVAEAADHVVRVDGDIWLANQSPVPYRLHISAGMASLDPIELAVTSDGVVPASNVTVTTNSYATSDLHRSVIQVLQQALLTPTEQHAGPDLWRTWDDPFAT